MHLIARLGAAARRSAVTDRWTNVYGLSRSFFALGSALTLAVTDPTTLFAPIPGFLDPPKCEGVASSIGLFCLVPDDGLDVARRLAVVVLLVVATGWRPRITGVVHWWISFSFVASTTIQDGGDQVAAIVTLLLIPWTLTDRRKWHWARPDPSAKPRPTAGLLVFACYALVRIQIAVVYFHSFTAKLTVDKWLDGTALYYFVQDPIVGAPSWLQPVVFAALRFPVVAAAMTWGALLIELTLALALVMHRRWWRPLLVVGILFHLSIALVVGAASFSIAMTAALILYLRPPETEFGRLYRLRVPRRLRELVRPGLKSPGLTQPYDGL